MKELGASHKGYGANPIPSWERWLAGPGQGDPRSLITAGVLSVIVSLWKMPDALRLN
ncbi:hypothetical protein [Leptolyngbya sp. 'hensonii']|uniref:hypothetical protein n=1 Tax=Leptolyngbya sp. 'hensonii' TaxID=1922337 RepID=UPI000A5EBA09|nr:hypothetical protein [Leptolyngbya sp. 'hensonii']